MFEKNIVSQQKRHKLPSFQDFSSAMSVITPLVYKLINIDTWGIKTPQKPKDSFGSFEPHWILQGSKTPGQRSKKLLVWSTNVLLQYNLYKEKFKLRLKHFRFESYIGVEDHNWYWFWMNRNCFRLLNKEINAKKLLNQKTRRKEDKQFDEEILQKNRERVRRFREKKSLEEALARQIKY